MRRIGIVIGTTRQGRFGDKPAAWIARQLARYPGLVGELIDLRDHELPFFDEAMSPVYAPPVCPGASSWSQRIAAMDGFIFVTAEYNHGISGVLKNALDHAYREFNRKPAAFVGYGGVGAARAVEQLRLIAVELQMAPLRHAVHITLEPYLAVMSGRKTIEDFDFLVTGAAALLDELAWWTEALAVARTPRMEAMSM